MTDNRLRALIIGGDERNITETLLEWVNPTHVESDAKHLNTAPPDIAVVIVITRWVSHGMFDKGRKLAKNRGVPLVQAHTGNYILQELVRHKVLPDAAIQVAKKKKEQEPAPLPVVTPEPVAPEPTSEPVTVESTGLTPEEIWELYGSKAIEVVKGALKGGEKIHEDDLMQLFSMADGGVGLPKESALHLLPELAVIGVIFNVKGKTWQTPNLDVEFDYRTGDVAESETPPEDGEEVVPVLVEEIVKRKKVEKRERAESTLVWVELLGGVNPGPYPTQVAVWREAMRYEEFSKSDGQPLTEEYYWKIIPQAIEYGVVERLKDGSYAVVPDDKVKLTLRGGDVQTPDEVVVPEKKKSKKELIKEAKAAKKAAEKAAASVPVLDVQPPAPVKVKETKSSNPVIQIRNHYGGTIPVLDRYTATTRVLKRMMPERYWHEAASRTVGRICGVKDHDQCAELQESFDVEEWDRLALDTLRQLPIETILPFLKDVPQDMNLTCVDCATKFLFTVSEQDYIKRMVEKREFESYEIPKRCVECRKKARASRV